MSDFNPLLVISRDPAGDVSGYQMMQPLALVGGTVFLPGQAVVLIRL